MKFYRIEINPKYDIDWDDEVKYDQVHGCVEIDQWVPAVKCCNGSMGHGLLPYRINNKITDICNVEPGIKIEIHQFLDLKQRMFDEYGADPEIYYLYPGIAFLPIKYSSPRIPFLDWATPFFQGIHIVNKRISDLLGSKFDQFICLERLFGSSYSALIPRLVPIYKFKYHSVQPCRRCGRVWVRKEVHHPEIDPNVADLNWPIFKTPLNSNTYVNQHFKEMLEDFAVLGIVFVGVDVE